MQRSGCMIGLRFSASTKGVESRTASSSEFSACLKVRVYIYIEIGFKGYRGYIGDIQGFIGFRVYGFGRPGPQSLIQSNPRPETPS